MKTPRAFRVGALALALSFIASPLLAAVDLDSDTVGDIWRLQSGMTGPAAADADGDGQSNAQESGAGTDPNSSADLIAVSDMSLSGNSLTLSWPSIVGKRYKIQSTTTLNNSASWIDVSPAFLDGTGAEM